MGLAAGLLAAVVAGGCDCDGGVDQLLPKLEVQPRALDFGITAIGTVATERLRLKNTGTAPLALEGFEVTGDGAAAFVAPGSEAPASIPPAGEVEVEVGFAPQA
ncbi:MAG: choice-of-anchor D domain-containing protein, partial [Deltaproteobacteria bacterium]